MAGTTRVEIRTLRVGRYCCVEDKAYKINSISTSKPGKHGSAKARIELVEIFTGAKISHVGSVSSTINVPLIEKGTALVTHIEGSEVHAMNMKDHSMMILPLDEGLDIEGGKEIMWMEALGLYKIIR
ncbi:MAG: translation initiation factor IF-5A, partial [Candidatus Poseidoniales archaeon]